MSGIVAAFGAGATAGVASVASVTALLCEHLSHRGPDGVGVEASGNAVVAHARLAVVDISGGRQPMQGEDGRVLLVCNGEIYNHRLLRRQLAGDHQLRSGSDSEVILHLFEDQGAECVRSIDGMFAFVVTDGERFVAARDPFGIKPLYVGQARDGGVWFASEFKALIQQCPSFEAVAPGSVVRERGLRERWFMPDWAERPGTSLDASPEELLRRLERAVVKRLMSDVPIGVFVSGGLDSSLVAALARRHQSRLQTFTVGLEGADDLAAARLVARELGSDHYERSYSVKDVAHRLNEVVYHLESYDPELVQSALPCYFMAELAAEHVKVVLTGDGADELFAGYPAMLALREPSALHRACTQRLGGMHSTSLQRLDRMTMAHGLEGRVPFLDAAFVDWAMALDPELKVHRAGGPGKALLRAAAQLVLPTLIAQRPKAESPWGAAAALALEQHAAGRISDRDLAGAAQRFPVDTPRSKEELLYRLIFDDLFPGEAARTAGARSSLELV